MIGILGGMGPLATSIFYQILLRQVSETTHDNEYPSCLISSSTSIPSRTRAFLYNEESPIPYFRKTIEMFNENGVKFFCCPCNSAHYFLNQMKELPLPFINLLDSTIDKCLVEGVKNPLILGGEVTVQGELYEDRLNCVYPNKQDQGIIREIIDGIKSGWEETRIINYEKERFLQILNNYSVDGVILACTELAVFSEIFYNKTIIDSTHCLAERVINEYWN